MQFKKASKKQSRLRMALIGPSGSGKTFTALKVGSRLGAKVAVVDTERGSASKYADLFGFDVLELETFHPSKYIEAIEAAGKAGYDVVILDSLSHAWMGKDGALELVDGAAKRSKSGNSFAAWREVTPLHNALVDAILRAPMHVIATMRTKTEWVLEKDEKTGKQTPRKVGMQPVQRDGLEYEFDLVGDMDESTLCVTKTRCPALAKAVIQTPGDELARTLTAWLSDGEAKPEPLRTPAQGIKKAPALVDVNAGESEEEAEARQSKPVTAEQSPALRARANRIWQASGQTKEYFPLWIASVLGESKPSATWTEDDCDKLEDVIHRQSAATQ